MSEWLLEIEDLSKSYADKCILADIDLRVRQGELCTLVGPSGCGKSTLLRLILGQETVDAGRLLINGEPVGRPDPKRGIVYQRYSLYPHLTVLENVMLGETLPANWLQQRIIKKNNQELARDYLQRVRLEAHADKYPHQLSGGMQQRVAIVQSLLKKPSILLMDEPFGALDPDTREEMQMFLLELWEDEPMTVFFITHDLEEAVFLGTRILVLSQYYSENRGAPADVPRGSRIVVDQKLPKNVSATSVKHESRFIELIEKLRRDGFDPKYLQHVTEFNLNHPDAFQTLDELAGS